MSLLRLLVTGLILVAGIVASHGMKPPIGPHEHQPLRDFPVVIDGQHSEEIPFTAEDMKEIGVDDYTNREYFGGSRPVELYIGYYKDQRSGDAIHSPKNCLPGSGWQPVRAASLQIGSATNPVIVNEYVVEKGTMRDLVLYWYQAHGRVIASEYSGKAWLVYDAITRNRTDEALVRVLTSTKNGEDQARARAVQFVQALYPRLTTFIPN